MDWLIPSERAAAFICAANAGTEPETPSAIVTETSLADFTMMILSALSSVTSEPGRKPIFEGAMRAARLETTSGVCSVSLPS